MNMRRTPSHFAVDRAVKADVRRIEALWAQCRAAHSKRGPFLFGKFSAADAMYAPVVNRLHVYGFKVGAEARDYMQAMMALAAWQEWEATAPPSPGSSPTKISEQGFSLFGFERQLRRG